MSGKKRKITFKGIFSIIIGMIIGGLIGILAAFISINYIDVIFESHGIGIELLKILILFLILFFSFYGQIVIHEAGHLIFGLLSGYHFVSFRVGSVTLVKDEGRWKLKKFTLPGTGGQCLMMPPEIEDGRVPFIMYNLGGALINFTTGIIAILLVVLLKDMFSLYKGALLIFGVVGIFYALLNGIPLKLSGIANDGSNLLALMKNEEARRAFNLQLSFNGLLTAGQRPRDRDIREFKLKEGADLTNPLNTAMVLMEYNCYLDTMNFEKGRELFQKLKPYMQDILGLYKYEIQCEQVFLELVLHGDKDLVEQLYDKGLEKYIKACKGMISKARIRMCYELLYNKNIEKAREIYEEGKALAKTYPIKGEIEMELMLMEYLINLSTAEG